MQIDVYKDWWQFVAMAVLSYLIGCVNSAVIISKIQKKTSPKWAAETPAQ